MLLLVVLFAFVSVAHINFVSVVRFDMITCNSIFHWLNFNQWPSNLYIGISEIVSGLWALSFSKIVLYYLLVLIFYTKQLFWNSSSLRCQDNKIPFHDLKMKVVWFFVTEWIVFVVKKHICINYLRKYNLNQAYIYTAKMNILTVITNNGFCQYYKKIINRCFSTYFT